MQAFKRTNEILATLGQNGSRLPIRLSGEIIPSMRVENHAICAQGNKVLTERTDHVLTADGTPSASIRVMGIFEVENGRIAAWRDYFDTVPFMAAGQSAG